MNDGHQDLKDKFFEVVAALRYSGLSPAKLENLLHAAIAKADPQTRKLPRGVYEKFPGSGDYWIRFHDDQGKLRRQRIGPSLAAARDLVEQRRTEVRLGKFDPDSVGRKRRPKMTVAEMFATYLPLRKVRNKTEDARYAALWTKELGEWTLDEVTPADIDKWRARNATVERKRGKNTVLIELKPSTLNRPIEYLRAYFNLAIRDEHCEKNPCDRVKLPEENSARHRVLEEEEETKLRGQMSESDFRLVRFAVITGLRQAEQFRLAWNHVDWKTKNLRIPLAKSGKHRFVPLSEEALRLLETLRTESKGSPWVFPSPKRPGVYRDAGAFVREHFKAACKEVGIRGLTWHDLRRTCGSRLARAGVPLYNVQRILDHADHDTTAAHYAHLREDDLRESMEKLSPQPDKPKDPNPKTDATE